MPLPCVPTAFQCLSLLSLRVHREPGRDPYLQHCYRVSLDDGAPPLLLTPEPAEHTVSFSPDGGAVFVDAYGRADLPARTVLRSSADGSVLCVMEVADVTALERVGWRCPTPFEGVAADGVTVANADTIAAATHSHSS